MFQGVGNFGLWILDFSPRLRDTLTRGFFPAVAGHTYAWIGEEIAHAKGAKAAKDAKPDACRGRPTARLDCSRQAPTRAPTQVGAGRGKVAKDAKEERR